MRVSCRIILIFSVSLGPRSQLAFACLTLLVRLTNEKKEKKERNCKKLNIKNEPST